jgi:hypothetical protein
MTSTKKDFSLKRFSFRYKATCLVCIVFLVAVAASVVPVVQGDDLDNTDTQAVMKANFLFHFAASNEWPAETKTGPFQMVVLENERLFLELIDKYALKPIGVQPLEIVFFRSPSDMNLSDAPHLIYLESSEGLGDFPKDWEDQPILIVTDADTGLANGSTINFVAVDRRLRYEINRKEAANKGLLLGSRILSWAINSDK